MRGTWVSARQQRCARRSPRPVPPPRCMFWQQVLAVFGSSSLSKLSIDDAGKCPPRIEERPSSARPARAPPRPVPLYLIGMAHRSPRHKARIPNPEPLIPELKTADIRCGGVQGALRGGEPAAHGAQPGWAGASRPCPSTARGPPSRQQRSPVADGGAAVAAPHRKLPA